MWLVLCGECPGFLGRSAPLDVGLRAWFVLPFRSLRCSVGVRKSGGVPLADWSGEASEGGAQRSLLLMGGFVPGVGDELRDCNSRVEHEACMSWSRGALVDGAMPVAD